MLIPSHKQATICARFSVLNLLTMLTIVPVRTDKFDGQRQISTRLKFEMLRSSKRCCTLGIVDHGIVNGLDLAALSARLKKDIASAEARRDEAIQRVTELHELLKNTQQLLEYATGTPQSGEKAQQTKVSPTTGSIADQVVQAFRDDPAQVLSMNTIVERVMAANSEARAASVRNAVYYAAGTGKRLKKSGRGRFVLRDSSAPDTTGAEVEGTA
jgi:hypothetical protein